MPARNFSNTKPGAPRVDIVLPVYNEEKDLPRSVATLHEFLERNCPYDWRIVVANNASTDSTAEIANKLAADHARVRALNLPLKGRGRALRQAWLTSDADILSYMDIDLSTDLQCFMPLIEPLVNGQADIAAGSRYKKGAQVQRGLKREVLSRGYIALIKLFFSCRFTDSQCGFKAVTRRAAQTLIPLIENQGWFFDAELLLLAERHGLRIFDLPVRWVDDPDSRVKILQTVSEHFIGLARMRLAFSTGFAAAPAPKSFEIELNNSITLSKLRIAEGNFEECVY